MDPTIDIVALGESLIDFTPAGINERGIRLFGCNPGGAPANVLAMAARLGERTAFIGKVGRDAFGRFLADTMTQAGIALGGLCWDDEIPTTLAFVQLSETGERQFTFYRKPGADVRLTPEEVPADLVAACRVFHFGGVSLTDEPCCSATLQAARAARAAGVLVSYDPNYRPFLWKSEADARSRLGAAVPLADLIKVSQEEAALLTGFADPARAAQALAAQGPCIVVVTLGSDGAFFHAPGGSGHVPGFPADTADTTGAGDAFWGAFLHRILAQGAAPAALSAQQLTDAVRFANAAGRLTTTALGAIPAMPSKSAVDALVSAKNE